MSTVVLCFAFFFFVSFSPHARTQDTVVITIASALVAILPQVLQFYFGSAKKQNDEPGTTTTTMTTTVTPKEPLPLEGLGEEPKKP